MDSVVTCECSCYFFFNDTATTEIYTLSLHDALPICTVGGTNCPEAAFKTFDNTSDHWGTAAGIGSSGSLSQTTMGINRDRNYDDRGFIGTWYNYKKGLNNESTGFICSCNRLKVTLDFAKTTDYKNYKFKYVYGQNNTPEGTWENVLIRSEEHTLNSSHIPLSRMPSSA